MVECAQLFDTYLFKIYGYSPEREKEKRREQWRRLNGYNRDPSTVLPLLREFLPKYQGVIKHGAIQVNGLHYKHPLLAYWPEAQVTIRVSLEAESRCWVYIGGDVLCEARARELRRRDGSYRDNRDW
jgi:hypothetical protein